MIRTYLYACHLPKVEADALNHESGRIYTRALVEHYRVYRQTGHWLSPFKLKQLVDFYDTQDGRARLLHSHTTDAAQEGFPKACKTARECRKLGLDNRYPYKRKYWRTTIWKQTGIQPTASGLLLKRAKGQPPISVSLPNLSGDVLEARLVYDRVGRQYDWHIVTDDRREPPSAPGVNVAAVDLGEVHPAAVTDGNESVVFACRALRAVKQHGHKRRAELQRLQAAKTKGSLAWKKLQRRKTRFAAQQQRRLRDIEHKVSRAVVDWAVQRKVGTLAIGDVRDIGDGKRLKTISQQKVSSWGHGKLREYCTYKAEAEGMNVPLVEEHHSSQTCPMCGQRHKPSGRVYRCPACGFVGHRDGQVGAVNLLSRHTQGEVGRLRPPATTKYRHPFGRLAFGTGKRSRLDTAQVAWAGQHD